MHLTKNITSILLVMCLVTASFLTGCSSDNTVIVGSKDFSENIVVGEMFAQLIEAKTDLKVDRKLNMGGTFVCFEALKNGDVDVYPEYTGTALTAQLNMDVINDPDEAYRVVSDEFDKQFDIKWLEPMGFNNTYALAITDEAYQKYGVETCSDLAEVSNELVFGSDHEFFNRQDGFDAVTEAYGLEFKGEPTKMDISLKYQAIGEGDIDLTNVFMTDGPIRQYNLKVLEDDKSFFPPYYASPIIRNDTLEKHPELEDILNSLAGKIDDEKMIEVNYKVDVEGQAVEDAAREFLETNGLL